MKFLPSFQTAWTTAVKFCKDNPKKLLCILVCIAAFYGGLKVKESFEAIKTENETLVLKVAQMDREKLQLQKDISACVIANEGNKNTIEQISIAALDYQKQVLELKKTKTRLIDSNQALIKAIETAPPEEDGEVAKVLEDTIKTIQRQREDSK